MPQYFPDIPGASLPAVTSAELRRRWIARRARISDHAVNLLIELAFGTHDDDGWPPCLVPSERHCLEMENA